MKKAVMRMAEMLLMLSLVMSVFYLKEASQPEKMEIPVTQVLSYTPDATQKPSALENFQMQRETEYQADMDKLAELAENGDEEAKDYMLSAIMRHEKETAVEGVLAANGLQGAVCAVREGVVTICVQEKVDASRAQSILEICEKITGECAENVFLLDECGYLW